jgi:hypothetical protein
MDNDKAPQTDFLAELPIHLSNVSEHYFDNGLCLSGKLNNFKVTITENRVKIFDASLTKFYLGNNIQMMNRKDVKNAIELLSDKLHLDIGIAKVQHFEYGKNIVTKYPPEVYFRYLGNKPYSNRFEQKSSLYYMQTFSDFIGYDKIREAKKKGETIPELYKHCNLLRFEKRYKKNLANQFNCKEVIGNMLFDETFYTSIIDDWYFDYCKIHKIQLYKIDLNMIKTKEQYKLLGVLELVNMQGGELNALTNINEAFKKGEITKKQKHDLVELIQKATKSEVLTYKSDEITELDKKVKESIMYYR